MLGLTPSTKAERSTRILEIGYGKTGKTWDLLRGGNGPRAVVELESGVMDYEGAYDFDVTKIHSAKKLADWLEALKTQHGQFKEKYGLLGLDGFSKIWEESVENNMSNSGRVDFSKQASLKRPFTRITNAIKSLGNHGIDVIATGHAKKRWEVHGKDVQEAGIRGAMDERVFEAFSAVLYRFKEEIPQSDGSKKERYHTMVLASRYEHLGLVPGALIADWHPDVHLKAIFDRKPIPGTVAAEGVVEVKAETKDQILRICKEYGSRANGGKLDNSLVQEALPFTRGEGSEQDATQLLVRLRAEESKIEAGAVTG